MMEYIGYIILFLCTVAWLVLIFMEIIDTTFGVIFLFFLVGFGFLFAKTLKDRIGNKEDDHYSKHVDQ